MCARWRSVSLAPVGKACPSRPLANLRACWRHARPMANRAQVRPARPRHAHASFAPARGASVRHALMPVVHGASHHGCVACGVSCAPVGTARPAASPLPVLSCLLLQPSSGPVLSCRPFQPSSPAVLTFCPLIRAQVRPFGSTNACSAVSSACMRSLTPSCALQLHPLHLQLSWSLTPRMRAPTLSRPLKPSVLGLASHAVFSGVAI